MPNTQNIQQLDLNLLKVFQTLYVEQNMTRSAEVLNITPSAVSHAVNRLRDSLDDPLFRRSQNKMLPTAVCQRMAPAILEALSRLQQALQQWGEFDPASSHYTFRLGLHDALEPLVIPKLAQRLAAAAPLVSFSSVKFDRSELLRELAAGNLDVALDVRLNSKAPLKSAKLIENEFVLMLRKSHPLIDKLRRSDYLQAKHLNVSNRPSGMTIEDSLFQSQGLSRQTGIRCQNYFAAKEILKTSDHLLTIPQLLAEQLHDPDLAIRPLPLKIPGFTTHLYWHEYTDRDAALMWFRTVVADLFSD